MIRRGFFQESIQRRLVQLAMRTSGVALGLAVAAFSAYEYAVVRGEARRDLASQAELLAANVGAAAAFDDAEHAERSLQSLRSRPQFERACLLNADGAVVAGYRRGDAGRSREVPADLPAGVHARGRSLAVWVPVVHQGTLVGRLYVETGFRPAGTRYAQFVALAALVLLAAWSIAIWLAAGLQRRISGPILALARTAREITERRDYAVRAARQGRDELGQLADGFNEMLDQIQARDAALQAAHDGLERRVAARTRELLDEIVERRRVEAALADEKERLDVTLRSIGDAVITTDATGRVLLMNPVAEQLAGLGAREAAGRPLLEVLPRVQEQTREPLEDPVALVLRAGGPLDLGEGLLAGARRAPAPFIAGSGAPIRDREGRSAGAVLVFRDVTEKRHTADELLRASKLESIGVLAGGIAHDFNNILTVIIGNLSMARLYAPAGSTVAETLEAAERASIRAGDLTRQLLTFAKGGAPVRKTASLGELIRETAEFVLHGSRVACQYSIPEDLWPAEVDVGQISQVIHNLVLNAVQAMPNGGILRISAGNEEVGEGGALPLRAGRYVAIAIADHGPGIASEHLARIFEPYFTTKAHGSGLGLATSYSIIRRHEGHIGVESTPGCGTTFRIRLPAGSRAAAAAAAGPDVRGGHGRVLVMDDDPSVLQVAAIMLRHLGYETVTAPDGVAAVELYRAARDAPRPFSAVILDLTVPGGQGGRETVGQLRQLDPEVKVLVSSGYSDDPVMAEYRRHGFGGVVAKPYDIGELGRALHALLQAPSPAPAA